MWADREENRDFGEVMVTGRTMDGGMEVGDEHELDFKFKIDKAVEKKPPENLFIYT